MKTRRIVLMGLVLSLLCTVTAFADSATYYDGYVKAKLRVNDMDMVEKSVPPFVIDGATVVPLRQAADALHSLVKWDSASKTADLYLPNVSMFFSEDVSGKDYTIKKPFSRVDMGKNLNFVIFVQVDSLKTAVDGFKITINSPDGTVADSKEEQRPISDDSFWYTYPTKIKFSQSGTYTVDFSFLYDGDYHVVGQKTILSE